MPYPIIIKSYYAGPQWWRNYVDFHINSVGDANKMFVRMIRAESVSINHSVDESLKQIGFKREISDDYVQSLVAPSEEEMALFILKWS